LLATAAYAALTFVMALPLSAAPGRLVVADAPDTHLYIWTLAWDAHAFLHQPLRIFDANIYHPYANTLAYSENLIGTAFLAAPVLWLTNNPVLAMNLAALLTVVLCGAGAYLLARRLHLSVGAAFLCGLIFAFAPPRFFKTGQLHMAAMQWLPFALAFLHTYFERGRARDLRAAIGFFSLQALSSGHGAVFLILAATALALWRVALGEPIRVMTRLRDVGVTGAYLAAPAVWVALPYRLAQAEAGLRREFAPEAQPGLESFFASPARFHLLLQQRLFGRTINDDAIAFLFPGILLALLVAAAFLLARSGAETRASSDGAIDWRARWRNHAAAFYGFVALGSALLFVQWPIDIWRLVYWWPAFNFIRVPARFMILTMLALSVLGAIGFDRLAARVRPRFRTAATVFTAVLLLAEYNSYPFTAVPFNVEITAADRWLASRPTPFVVAEVPVPPTANLGALERQQTAAMLRATAHWQKTVHGYSGIRRDLHDRLYRELHTFPDAESIQSLRALGVTYVIVRTSAYEPAAWAQAAAQLAATPALKLEYEDSTDRVYALLSR
jgi:hypothetical protein